MPDCPENENDGVTVAVDNDVVVGAAAAPNENEVTGPNAEVDDVVIAGAVENENVDGAVAVVTLVLAEGVGNEKSEADEVAAVVVVGAAGKENRDDD